MIEKYDKVPLLIADSQCVIPSICNRLSWWQNKKTHFCMYWRINANAMNIDWNFLKSEPFQLQILWMFRGKLSERKHVLLLFWILEYFIAAKFVIQIEETKERKKKWHSDWMIIVCVLRDFWYFEWLLLESRLCCFHRYDCTKCDQNNRNMAPMRWIRYQNQHHLFKLDLEGKTNAQHTSSVIIS